MPSRRPWAKYKKGGNTKNVFFHIFLLFFQPFSIYLALARPNIAEKGAAIVESIGKGFGKDLKNSDFWKCRF